MPEAAAIFMPPIALPVLSTSVKLNCAPKLLLPSKLSVAESDPAELGAMFAEALVVSEPSTRTRSPGATGIDVVQGPPVEAVMVHCPKEFPLRLTSARMLDARRLPEAEPDTTRVALRVALVARFGKVKESLNEAPVVVAVLRPVEPDDDDAVA